MVWVIMAYKPSVSPNREIEALELNAKKPMTRRSEIWIAGRSRNAIQEVFIRKEKTSNCPLWSLPTKNVGTPYNKKPGFVNSSDYTTNSFLRIPEMGTNLDMVNGQQNFYVCPNYRYAMH